MKRKLAILLCSAAILTSCGVYSKYQVPETVDADTAQAYLPEWREYFSDPMLQDLIDTALVRNTTLAIAGIRLRQTDESLRASKLAYIPSVFFTPNGGISVNRQQQTSYSYQLPISLEWNFGAPGTLFARRHQAQAKRLQAIDNMNAVRNEIISQIAASYYMLQMLDEQTEILSKSIDGGNIRLILKSDFVFNKSKFNTNKVVDMSNMFYNNKSLYINIIIYI